MVTACAKCVQAHLPTKATQTGSKLDLVTVVLMTTHCRPVLQPVLLSKSAAMQFYRHYAQDQHLAAQELEQHKSCVYN